jgi:HD-GYP domain-containing protein (c-di-GMP phosphodiesterase class II)
VNYSRPNLSILTPDPEPPPPPGAFLTRCTELGLLAYQFADPEAMVAASRQPPDLEAVLTRGAVREAIRARLMRVAEDGSRVAQETIFPGITIGVVAHRSGPLPAGFTVLIFVSDSAFAEGVIPKWCEEHGPTIEQLRALAAPYAQLSSADIHLVMRSLLGTARDLEKIQEQGSALDGFAVQLTDSYDTMDLLYSVGRSMREPFNPEQFLNFVCGRLFSARSFRWVTISFSAEKTVASRLRNLLVVSGKLPCAAERVRQISMKLLPRLAAPQVLEQVEQLSTREHPQVMVQPLMCKGQVIGVLAAGGKHGEDPDISSYDIQLIEAAAGYINAFSDNVALYEDQHTLFMGTVQAMTAAIDAKDRYTFGHSERVAHVASQLAMAVGMSREQAERVRIAGLVHDVGKIGVPEGVLTKQGRLTDEEFAHIKKHPEIGYTILRDIHLLEDVLPGVLHHHERYDGRGYPHGLAGEKIPFIARILAVADTFDAMSSTRSYRSAMAREVVLAEIGRCSGTQFDPALAMAFVKLDLSVYDAMVARHAAGHVAAVAA